MGTETTARILLSRYAQALLLLSLLVPLAFAQQLSGDAQSGKAFYNPFNNKTNLSNDPNAHGNGAILRLTVLMQDGKTRLDRPSLVKVTDVVTHNTITFATDGNSGAHFFLATGKYEIDISAVGFLSGHKEFQALNSPKDIPVDFLLHSDPDALVFDVAEGSVPTKVLADVKRSVSDLKSGDLKDAKKRLGSAHKLESSSSDVDYLLGCESYQERDFGKARSYLETASGLDPKNVHTLALLGRVELMLKDNNAAVSTLEKAVAADSEDWVSHSLLARAYLIQEKVGAAREQAELALQKGKQEAVSANLILGVALANLGKTQEAIQALKLVVQDSPKSPEGIQASSVIAQLEK